MSEAHEPRFLGRRAGYVNHPSRGMPGEPEALTEDEQIAVTEAARRRVLDQRIAARQATAAEIETELRWAESRCRYLNRQLRRLGRPVG